VARLIGVGRPDLLDPGVVTSLEPVLVAVPTESGVLTR
jgi:hypothetical protein